MRLSEQIGPPCDKDIQMFLMGIYYLADQRQRPYGNRNFQFEIDESHLSMHSNLL